MRLVELGPTIFASASSTHINKKRSLSFTNIYRDSSLHHPWLGICYSRVFWLPPEQRAWKIRGLVGTWGSHSWDAGRVSCSNFACPCRYPSSIEIRSANLWRPRVTQLLWHWGKNQRNEAARWHPSLVMLPCRVAVDVIQPSKSQVQYLERHTRILTSVNVKMVHKPSSPRCLDASVYIGKYYCNYIDAWQCDTWVYPTIWRI